MDRLSLLQRSYSTPDSQAAQGVATHVPVAPRHVPELDSLRGVAAVAVVFNHFHLAWLASGTAPAWCVHFRLNPLLWLLVDGHASVMLFFLLSGFVLMLPHLRGSTPGYPAYAVRRFLRIYPTYWAALGMAALLCACFTGGPSVGHAIGTNWPRLPDAHSLLRHLFLVMPVDIYRYDNPVWSLVHEARISLLFPLMAFAALRLRVPATLAVAGLCSAAAPFLLRHVEGTLPQTMHMTAWSYTVNYSGVFLLGAALARRRERCVALLDGLPHAGRVALFATALVLYLYPVGGWHLLQRGDLCTALAGTVLLTFALRHHGTVARLLRLRPIHFLGTISYSLYLIHMPVLLALCAVLPRRLPFPLVLPLYLPVSLAAAVVLHRLVEAPSIRWSRQAGKRVPPSLSRLSRIPSYLRLYQHTQPGHSLSQVPK